MFGTFFFNMCWGDITRLSEEFSYFSALRTTEYGVIIYWNEFDLQIYDVKLLEPCFR